MRSRDFFLLHGSDLNLRKSSLFWHERRHGPSLAFSSRICRGSKYRRLYIRELTRLKGIFQAKRYLAVELEAIVNYLTVLPSLDLVVALCGIHSDYRGLRLTLFIDGCIALLNISDLSIVSKLVRDGTIHTVTTRYGHGDDEPAIAAVSAPRDDAPVWCSTSFAIRRWSSCRYPPE